MTMFETPPHRAGPYPISTSLWLVHAAYRTFQAFPIACFSLTVLTDIAYWQTSNLLWLHFSEWLLLAGLVFGAFAAVARIVGYAMTSMAPSWLRLLGCAVAYLLAILNSFIHTADGWTAVVPTGLAVSIATVIVMAAAGWVGRKEVFHV